MTEIEQSNTKKRILEHLEDYHGIVTDACAKAGIARSTFYEWLKSDEAFKAAVDDIQETALDFVEGQLFKKISGIEVQQGENIFSQPPSDTAIIFYLKTRGKKRGYIERTELTGADGKPVITETHVKIIRDKGTSTPLSDTPLQSAEGSES